MVTILYRVGQATTSNGFIVCVLVLGASTGRGVELGYRILFWVILMRRPVVEIRAIAPEQVSSAGRLSVSW
jgi:hypothetical protein